MDKENKYYGIIENLVRNHKKFSGLEAIIEDIIDDVYTHSQTVIETINDESVITSYLTKVVSTSIITVPKRLNYKNESTHQTANYSIPVKTITQIVQEQEELKPKTVENKEQEPLNEELIEVAQDEIIEDADDTLASLVVEEEIIEDEDKFTLDIAEEEKEPEQESASVNSNFVDKMINSITEDTIKENGLSEDIEEDLENVLTNVDAKEEPDVQEFDAIEDDENIVENIYFNEEAEQSDDIVESVYANDEAEQSNDIIENVYADDEIEQPDDIIENIFTNEEAEQSNDIVENTYTNEEAEQSNDIVENTYTNEEVEPLEDIIEEQDQSANVDILDENIETIGLETDAFENIEENNEIETLDFSDSHFDDEQIGLEEGSLGEIEENDLLEVTDDDSEASIGFIDDTEEELLESDNIMDITLEGDDSSSDLMISENNDESEVAERVDFKPVDYSVFEYNPDEKGNYYENDDIAVKLLEIDKQEPNLNILKIFDLKYKQNMTVDEITAELNLEQKDVIAALDMMVELI